MHADLSIDHAIAPEHRALVLAVGLSIALHLFAGYAVTTWRSESLQSAPSARHIAVSLVHQQLDQVFNENSPSSTVLPADIAALESSIEHSVPAAAARSEPAPNEVVGKAEIEPLVTTPTTAARSEPAPNEVVGKAEVEPLVTTAITAARSELAPNEVVGKAEVEPLVTTATAVVVQSEAALQTAFAPRRQHILEMGRRAKALLQHKKVLAEAKRERARKRSTRSTRQFKDSLAKERSARERSARERSARERSPRSDTNRSRISASTPSALQPSKSETPKAAVQSQAGPLRSAYLADIKRRLEARKTYPRQARRRRQQGTVTMHFAVARNGALNRVQVSRSSGHALLDQAAMSLVRDVSPFPPPPKHLAAATLELIVPIRYELAR